MNSLKKALLILMAFLVTMLAVAQTRTELKPSDLQKPIAEYITKNFSGYSISKVFKVDTKGVITFDICVSKDQNHEKLFFDKDGRYLRKESCTNDCCQVPPKK